MAHLPWMLLRQLCIQLIQQHGRPQVAQLNIQPGKQLLIIIPAILSAAARQLLHRILLKQRQRGQRFTAAFVLIIIRRLLLFRPLIAVILRLFARLSCCWSTVCSCSAMVLLLPRVVRLLSLFAVS